MTDHLPPCIFCGSPRVCLQREEMPWAKRKVVGVDEDNGPVYYIECESCAARGPLADWAIDARGKWQSVVTDNNLRTFISDAKETAIVLTHFQDRCGSAEADAARLRIAEGELKRENARLAAELAAMTKERDELAQHHGGHLPACRGMDEAAQRCDCGYLQGGAYRKMRAELAEAIEYRDRNFARWQETKDAGYKELAIRQQVERERDAAVAELAAMKGGAVTDSQVAVAQIAQAEDIHAQTKIRGQVGIDYMRAMRAALQAVAGMRGGG